MDNEATRLINNNGNMPSVNPASTAQAISGNQPSPKPRKSAAGSRATAVAGGFVGGVAAAMGASAIAADTDSAIPPAADETVDNLSSEEMQEATPEPEQVILANDEGIRYAHVNADNFNDAFAQAREQVGPGGVFEYEGRLYGTYSADEWNNMSAEERSEYQNRVNEVAPSRSGSSAHVQTASAPAHSEAVAPEVIPANAEMIAAEPVDNEIRVLGVEAVQNADGQIMNVALVECEGDQAMLVDVDNNGTIDVLIHDDNGDGYIQESELHDISGAGLDIADLMQAQAAQEGDILYASNDDMPDYMNDADSIMSV
ncbi:MAG: hypothetical protein K2O78_08090 [Muribaculaceae bacterium]|nr:hypothetical protein [Muribaculaceae bacterium]